MASITYDGQSFMIDGRRLWIVSGSIHYARVPRDLWAARIHAARLAGLNTIETPVIWARHEPRQGQFNFTGENDIRHFVQLVQQAGMSCILRPGPYIGAGWDLGGLPPWLLSMPEIRLRTNSAPFLEACSRYITALSQQIRDLQVTSTGEGGPILLIQSESAWTCGHDETAHAYLNELNRYYRESGLTVPIVNANELWQGIEGEIDCWTGYDNLLATLRQLSVVRPDQPRVVIDFKLGEPPVWGRPMPAPKSGEQVVRRLAEVLAAGGQVNISPFAAGTNFGFSAGRDGSSPDAFYATSYDPGSLITELGHPTPAYAQVRRLCTFASRFSRVFANLESRRVPVVQHPEAIPTGGATVVHTPGVHGSVAFVFADEQSPPASVTLLLPDGTTLPVPLGSGATAQSVAWCVFDARLTGRTNLDYCNLSAFAVVGRVFVCFGPPDAKGVLSINGSRLEVEVPSAGAAPTILEHEGIVVVVCTPGHIDTAFLDEDAVYLGVSGLAFVPARGSAAGSTHPIAHADHKTYTRITGGGAVTSHKAAPFGSAPVREPEPAPSKKKGAAAPVVTGPKLSLSHWSVAETNDYAKGVSARYATIAGPADLGVLGAPYGYGWYRVRFKSSAAGKRHILFPGAADRLHLTLDGEDAGVVGHGPGAADHATLTLKKGPHTLVVLAENLGRYTSGLRLAGKVGLHGHMWAVSPMKSGAPKIVDGDPVEPLAFFTPLWQVHRSEATDASRLTWTFQHRSKHPVFVRVGPMPGRGLVMLNNAPLAPFDTAGAGVLTLSAEALSRGNNTLQIAMLGGPGVAAEHARVIAEAVEMFDGEECLSEVPPPAKGKHAPPPGAGGTAEWAFAKWEPPHADAFESVGKAMPRAATTARWWKCPFNPDDSASPLLLDLTGMTKGQVYVNGQHLCRYFVAGPNGKPLGTQTLYHVPRSLVSRAGPSELMLFDEHGASPSKVRLTLPK